MKNKRSDQTKRTKPGEPRTTNKTYKSLRWLFSAFAILIIASAAIFLSSQTPVENQPAEILRPLRAIGPKSAPVTITEYADFGCISCQAWHRFGVREQIINHYGDQVRFVWRDFPVTTQQSPKAAEAGFCAQDQNRFWEYHNILFENAPNLTVADLKDYAEAIEMDTHAFNQCLDSGKYHQAAENELEDARALGLRGVPSFIVNDKRLIGPPSFEQLAATIDDLLESQQ